MQIQLHLNNQCPIQGESKKSDSFHIQISRITAVI